MMPAPLAILMILSIFAILALIWAWIDGRKPRPVVGAGMPDVPSDAPRSADEAMFEALVASGKIRREDWSRVAGEYLFVHDGTAEAELVAWIRRIEGGVGSRDFAWSPPATTEESEGTDEVAEEPIASTARERFRNELAVRGLETKVETVGTLFAPGPFDVYRLRGRG